MADTSSLGHLPLALRTAAASSTASASFAPCSSASILVKPLDSELAAEGAAGVCVPVGGAAGAGVGGGVAAGVAGK